MIEITPRRGHLFFNIALVLTLSTGAFTIPFSEISASASPKAVSLPKGTRPCC